MVDLVQKKEIRIPLVKEFIIINHLNVVISY